MEQFIEKYSDCIVGVLSGFDRLVLRGSPRRLNVSYWDPSRQVVVAKGMEEFLWQSGVLFKHYGDYLKKTSERVKKASTRAISEAGLPVIYVREAGVDEDEYARRVAAERGIRRGPVCVLSVLEPCPTFEYVQSRIVRRKRPCHVLYHYGWDETLGWMYARIQTWFPFHIQIGINGREWLAQQMRPQGLQFQQEKNCFTRIADFPRAQELMNQQLQTGWVDLLTGLARRLNPIHEEIFAKYPTPYYGTCYQSEWATDSVFRSGEQLKRWMPAILAHGMLSFHSSDVLRFFGKRTTRRAKSPGTFMANSRPAARSMRKASASSSGWTATPPKLIAR
ncbi:MAG: hypothetical protein WB755_29160 [Terriglobales bacterium]